MQTTTMLQHLSDLSKVDPNVMTKATKLLTKICDNIISNPSEPKYQDLNFEKIHKKLERCPSAVSLLYDIGFKLSNDGLRLKWVQNDTNSQSLHQLSQNLRRLIQITPSFDHKGSNSHKVRKIHTLLHRIKTPNDLSLNIMKHTKLIQQLQAQSDGTQAAHHLIQNLKDHTEAMKFVHALETAAKNDSDLYEVIEAFKKMTKLWSFTKVFGDSYASAKLEELIMKMKQLAEVGFAMSDLLQLVEGFDSSNIEEKNDGKENDDTNFVDELLSVLPGIDQNDLNEIGNMEDLLAAVDDDNNDDVSPNDTHSLCRGSCSSNAQTSDLEWATQLTMGIMAHSSDNK